MREDASLSFRVVEAVANHESVAPEELEVPLYSVIDPELLDQVGRDLASKPDTNFAVQFEYYGYEISIAGPDTISVTPLHQNQEHEVTEPQSEADD